MSKILRRPMFRGGPVNSEGTGITSGLNEGYATGGRVGYADGPSMFGVGYEPSSDVSSQQQKYNEFMKEYGGGEYFEPGATTDIYGKYVSGLEEKTKPAGFFEFATSALNPFKSTYGGVSRYGQQKDVEYATSDVGKQAIMSDIEKKRQQQAQIILANPKLAPDKVTAAKQILGITDESTGAGTGTGKDQNEISMDDVEARTEKYAKLLGYDKAKTQSIYDAMLAASPAFFKGRSFGETASGVLEAVNKSGAFDKPTNIKQAAAQLSIQREILMDKAKAEASAKMAELGYKKPSSLSDFYNANLKANQPVTEAKENAVRAKYGDSYREGVPFSKSTAKMGEIYKVPKNTADPKGPAMFIEINGQPPLGYKILIG
jgi:hypothetical protein